MCPKSIWSFPGLHRSCRSKFPYPMKKTVLFTFLLISSQLFAQLNIQFRSNLSYGVLCSNIGGYVDHAGNEYALLGWWNGLDIIDVTNPNAPVVKFTVPGNQSEW